MHQISIPTPCLLSDHLRDNRIPLKMSCGGHGSCKTCRVMLDGEPVLACQTMVEPATYDLTVPPSAASSKDIKIDLESLEDGLVAESPRWEITSEKPASHAIAIDVGTTTMAAALIDLNERRILASRGHLNGQYAYAEDLVARISFCHTTELLHEMRDLGLKGTLRPLVRGLLKDAGIPGREILTTVISGNAPMIHILLGLDPTSMGGWPFEAVDLTPVTRPASDLKLPGQQIEFIPAQSAYLGGDIISGLAHMDFANAPDGTLFVDLGTNAEMALKTGDRLLCTAAPAGPSFEGGGLPCGVSAIPGAIDQVWEEEGVLKYSTIGDRQAIGLCGSGIISFVAAAFRSGILRKKGRFARRHEHIEMRELLGHEQRVYVITDDIYISEDDISAFLQAKAAVFAGIITLCKVAGLDVLKLHQLQLAGNFGRRVRVRDMIDIGIIPPIPRESVEVCGNTSLKGAIHACLDKEFHIRTTALLSRLEFIDLNAQDSFQNDFINALFLPHLTMEF